MPRMIFVNLPVTDLERSIAFYEAVGGTKNPQFSDDTAACIVFSETIHAMICLSADSRDAVDAMVESAEGAGGRGDPGQKQDYGFMYGRSFEDPDGHHWEVMWMDMSQAPSADQLAEMEAEGLSS